MFFSLSKLLWFIADPGNLFVILLVLGVILIRTRWRRPGRWLLTVLALAAVFISVVPIGDKMFRVLEDRFPRPADLPADAAGIIVLGGFLNQFVAKKRKGAPVKISTGRITEFARLAGKYPNARLVFSGGSGSLTDQSVKEAHFVGPWLTSLGIDPARVISEDQSRNTAENATFTKALVKPGPGERWLLITSAFHMPRAVGAYRKAGWNVMPYPVDYHYAADESLGMFFSLSGGLSDLSSGIHEWLGLAFYRLTGKTDHFFPAP